MQQYQILVFLTALIIALISAYPIEKDVGPVEDQNQGIVETNVNDQALEEDDANEDDSDFIYDVDETAPEGQNPMHMGGHFEGDMILNDEQREYFMNPNARNALRSPTYHWPNAVAIYRFVDLSDNDKFLVTRAMGRIQNRTCIKFKETTDTTGPQMVIQKTNPGCGSAIGYQGVPQTVNLGDGCMSHGIIIHELLHALSFIHMQSAFKRDNFVTINWENIQEGRESNFNKYDSSEAMNFGIAYDYNSVMHYSRTEFSKNGKETVTPKDTTAVIGQRKGMSSLDIKRLNKVYCS